MVIKQKHLIVHELVGKRELVWLNGIWVLAVVFQQPEKVPQTFSDNVYLKIPIVKLRLVYFDEIYIYLDLILRRDPKPQDVHTVPVLCLLVQLAHAVYHISKRALIFTEFTQLVLIVQ